MIQRLFKSRFVRDSAILQASGLVIAASGVVTTLVLAHVLGDQLQGVFILAVSAYSLVFMLFNTGVNQAAVSQLGIAIPQARVDRIASWVAFLVKVYVFAGVFLAAIVGPFMPWLCEKFLADEHIGHLAWALMLIPLLDIPRVVAVVIFQGGRRMADVARLELVTESIRNVCVVVGALITLSPVGPVIGMLISTVGGSVYGLVLYRRARHGPWPKLPGVRAVLSHARDVPIRNGLALGVRIGVMRSLDALAYEILPPLFIKAAGHAAGFANAEAWVAHFRIAQRLMRLPVVFMQGISRTALPALGTFAAHGDGAGFKRAWLRVTLSTGALVAVAVGVTTLLVPWLVLVTPGAYHSNVIDMCRIMALGYGLMGTLVALDSFYILTNRLKIAIKMNVVAALLTFPGIYALGYYVPKTGGAWGMVLIMYCAIVHWVYVAWFFRSGQLETEFARHAAGTQDREAQGLATNADDALDEAAASAQAP